MAKRSRLQTDLDPPVTVQKDHDEEEAPTVANVQISKTTAETSKEVSGGADALAEERAKGVRIRIKDSGLISHVGWKLGEELVKRGRAVYVDD